MDIYKAFRYPEGFAIYCYIAFVMDNIDILIYILIAAIAVVIVVSLILKRKKLLAAGIQAEGVVFQLNYVNDISVDTSSGSTGMYYPVIRFLTKENEWITQQYDIGRYPSVYKEGDKVVIFYDPTDPTNFIIK